MAFQFKLGPWWGGGQFERLIGLFKRAFYNSIGNGTLKWSELEEVVLDVEVAALIFRRHSSTSSHTKLDASN